jgi:hypothetical protein
MKETTIYVDSRVYIYKYSILMKLIIMTLILLLG